MSNLIYGYIKTGCKEKLQVATGCKRKAQVVDTWGKEKL